MQNSVGAKKHKLFGEMNVESFLFLSFSVSFFYNAKT